MKTSSKRRLALNKIVYILAMAWLSNPHLSLAQEKSSITEKSADSKTQDAKSRDSEADKGAQPTSPPSIVVVQGAGGDPEYDEVFGDACAKIMSAARKRKADFEWIGVAGPTGKSASKTAQTDKEILQKILEKQKQGDSQFWLIFIGHGTFDRTNAKFNLRGPDLNAKELNEWLKPFRRPVAIINCSSASAPFINRLSAKNRVIVTATKSGFELNYVRFGSFFADGLSGMEADIDKDEQVSILESFLYASKKVAEFYKSESRLATEHALIDDNGDGKGTPLSFFRGIRVIKQSEGDSIPDGQVANQIHLIQSEFEKLISAKARTRRNQLELELEKLRLRKSTTDDDTYMAELEAIAVELATLYQEIESGMDTRSESLHPSKTRKASDSPNASPADKTNKK